MDAPVIPGYGTDCAEPRPVDQRTLLKPAATFTVVTSDGDRLTGTVTANSGPRPAEDEANPDNAFDPRFLVACKSRLGSTGLRRASGQLMSISYKITSSLPASVNVVPLINSLDANSSNGQVNRLSDVLVAAESAGEFRCLGGNETDPDSLVENLEPGVEQTANYLVFTPNAITPNDPTGAQSRGNDLVVDLNASIAASDPGELTFVGRQNVVRCRDALSRISVERIALNRRAALSRGCLG